MAELVGDEACGVFQAAAWPAGRSVPRALGLTEWRLCWAALGTLAVAHPYVSLDL